MGATTGAINEYRPAGRPTGARLTYRAMVIRRISVLGVGLLGGSIALAAKSAINDVEIIGYGHRAATLERAVDVGAIDRYAMKVTEAIEGADLVILCTPV